MVIYYGSTQMAAPKMTRLESLVIKVGSSLLVIYRRVRTFYAFLIGASFKFMRFRILVSDSFLFFSDERLHLHPSFLNFELHLGFSHPVFSISKLKMQSWGFGFFGLHLQGKNCIRPYLKRGKCLVLLIYCININNIC